MSKSADPSLDEYHNASAPPGTPRALALLFTPPSLRAGARSLIAFSDLMQRLAATHPEVAAAKATWWHEELARTAAGEARHPITRDLSAGGDAPVETLNALLHGAVMTINRVSVDDMDTFERYCQLCEGALHEALSTVAGRSRDDAERFGHAAGLALHTAALVDGGRDPQRAPPAWRDAAGSWLPEGRAEADAYFRAALERAREAADGDNPTSVLLLDLAEWRWPKAARRPMALDHLAALAYAWRRARVYRRRVAGRLNA